MLAVERRAADNDVRERQKRVRNVQAWAKINNHPSDKEVGVDSTGRGNGHLLHLVRVELFLDALGK